MAADLCHCLCIPVTLILVQHLGENVYMHQYMYICPSDMSAPAPMHSYMETWVPLCGTVVVSQWPYFWSHTLVHASVHLFMSSRLPISRHTLCIVTQHHGFSCMALCLCPSHLISVPTPWLECVHASVHVLMSTWVVNILLHPLCIVTWKHGSHVLHSVYVPVSPPLVPHLL